MGRGYSFDMLRARVLFGTSATKKYYKQHTKKKPTYTYRNYEWSTFNSGFNLFKTQIQSQAIECSCVDIFELNLILNNKKETG